MKIRTSRFFTFFPFSHWCHIQIWFRSIFLTIRIFQIIKKRKKEREKEYFFTWWAWHQLPPSFPASHCPSAAEGCSCWWAPACLAWGQVSGTATPCAQSLLPTGLQLNKFLIQTLFIYIYIRRTLFSRLYSRYNHIRTIIIKINIGYF